MQTRKNLQLPRITETTKRIIHYDKTLDTFCGLDVFSVWNFTSKFDFYRPFSRDCVNDFDTKEWNNCFITNNQEILLDLANFAW